MRKIIHLTIYCDEIKNMKIEDKKMKIYECWDYIGVLIVPTDNIASLAYELNKKRCPNKDFNSCKDNCIFHLKNHVKVHYQDYSTTNIYQIADRWCDTVINNNVDNKRFYTHILGINTANIDMSYFKLSDVETNVENNIYNKFFRTALIYPLKSFFNDYDEVVIDNIIHDCGAMDHHQYFKRQPLRIINEEVKNVTLNCREILSIQTTHENSLEPNNVMLQFIDMYLGAVMNCLHHSGKKNKEKIALKLYDVIERCINTPGNPNSRYYKVNSISFFPKHKIDESDDWIDAMYKRQDNFYHNRELRIGAKDQLSLFDFL